MNSSSSLYNKRSTRLVTEEKIDLEINFKAHIDCFSYLSIEVELPF